MAGDYKIIKAEVLEEFVCNVFENIGLEKEHAELAAKPLLYADLSGVDTHGVALLPIYVQRLKAGVINKTPSPKVIEETKTTAVFNGDNGMGHLVGQLAMDVAIEKAKEENIGMVAVRNSNHFGVCAFYASMALKHEMIGFCTTNGVPIMAPWGGSTHLFGNNPFSYAIPANKFPPFVLDVSTSKVAQAKIIRAAAKGERIPEGWALTKDGYPTQDPEEAMDGLIIPFGEHKGYGITLVNEILAGVISGSAISKEVGHLLKDYDNPQNVGHCMMTVNIRAFIDYDEFLDRMDRLIGWIKESKLADGFDEVFTPGEIEAKEYQERTKKGVPILNSTYEKLSKIAEDIGITGI